MDQNDLTMYINKPEVRQILLGHYKGGFSIGITRDPDQQDKLAIKIRIEGGDTTSILRRIVLGGETIAVVIETNFQEAFASGEQDGTSV